MEKLTKILIYAGIFLIGYGIVSYKIKEQQAIEASKTPRQHLEEAGFTFEDTQLGYVATYGTFELEVSNLGSSKFNEQYRAARFEEKRKECHGYIFGQYDHQVQCLARGDDGELTCTMLHYIFVKGDYMYSGSIKETDPEYEKVDKVMEKIYNKKL